MKKLVSLVLSAALLVMAAIVPMCASAAYATDQVIFTADFSQAAIGGVKHKAGVFYSISDVSPGSFVWYKKHNDQPTNDPGIPQIAADAEKGNVLTMSTSNYAVLQSITLMRGEFNRDVTSVAGSKYGVKVDFKVSGNNETYVSVWPTVTIISVEKLQTLLTSNAEVQALEKTDADGKQNQVLCITGNNTDLVNEIIPVCVLQNDKWYSLEYVYSFTGNNKYIQNVKVMQNDGSLVPCSLLSEKYLNGKTRFASSGYRTLQDFFYSESGRMDSVLEIAKPEVMTDSAPAQSVTLSVAKLSYESVAEVPLSVSEVLIDGQAAALDGNDTMRPSGSMTVRFSEEPTAPTVTLTEGAKTRVAPQGTLAGSDYVIDFANTPLHPGSTYTLKVTSGTASKEITFKTSFNGYYINDNFATYQTGGLSKDGDYWHHTASVDGRLDHKIVEMPDGRKALQFGLHAAGIKAGYDLVSTASIQNNMLPQENMSTLRTVEMTFMFEEMDERTRAEIWTSNFYVQKDEQGVYKLFAGLEGEGVTTGGNAICSLEAGKKYTVRIVYSSANQYDRFLHRMDVTEGGIKTEYLQTEAGKSFVDAPCKIYQHGGLFGLELRYAPSGSTMLFGLRHYKAGEGLPTTVIVKQGADTAATPTNLYIYSVAYGAYAAEDKDFAVSATRTSAEEGVAVTLSAEDFRGETHKESIIFAAYTDNTCTKLADLAVIDINLPRLGKVTQTVTLTKAAEENTIKMIRLQDWGKVQPVGAAAVVVQ